MKQILTTILLWTAFCLTGHAQAKATFDKKTHEFGVVLWKHPATAVFTVKNDGDKLGHCFLIKHFSFVPFLILYFI